jgi:hypothetical protein
MSHREPSCAARLFLQRYRRTTAESVAVGNAGAKTKARQEFEKSRPKDAAGSRESIAFAHSASVFRGAA